MYINRTNMCGRTWIYSIITFLYFVLSSSGAPIKDQDIRFLLGNHRVEGVPLTWRVWIYSQNSRLHLRVAGSQIDFNGRKTDSSTVMVLESVNIKGHISIKSEQENSYICVNAKNGNLVLESKGSQLKRCLFVEDFYLGYTVFKSVYNNKWFIGSKRSGHRKQPSTTGATQKAVRFLVEQLPQS
ncbi:uncharacterized protein LOC110238312 [Exaiptasia diaphana]|uniref:Fibroblast growth factor n=1 Tax=Exaiptasia diaphana TaxID=2652724 RepID=A0A913X6J4_EXADI|nr:uncharacterized protein LOC110238312 [Exaiptasia diaphana]KXJ14867.1 Fibroblast growth factor 18 [Exaiptasia diaphana]